MNMYHFIDFYVCIRFIIEYFDTLGILRIEMNNIIKF